MGFMFRYLVLFFLYVRDLRMSVDIMIMKFLVYKFVCVVEIYKFIYSYGNWYFMNINF